MKKLKFVWFILLIFSVSIITIAKAKNRIETTSEGDAKVKWTTIDKALAETKASNKKFIIVDLYTDWCGWCKKMDENTFTDAGVIALINTDFTIAKFNAETADAVTFNGKSYSFTKTGARGANQLAMELGSVGGKLGYPTLVVLDADGKKLQAFPGYKDVETLTIILKYFQSGSYKTMDFQQFQSGQ
jgi:thioredoxin-related protein